MAPNARFSSGVLRLHVSLLDVNAKECNCCRVEMNIIWLFSATHATHSTAQPPTRSLADTSTHTSTCVARFGLPESEERRGERNVNDSVFQ